MQRCCFGISTGCALLLACALVPTRALAQSGNAAIAGVVSDHAGGALAGVRVEASGPALRDTTRSALTNGRGVYTLTDLPPGHYVITFALASFTTITRQDVELTGASAATVNVTIGTGDDGGPETVSSEPPALDPHSVAVRVVTS